MECLLVGARNKSEESMSQCTLSTTAATRKVPGIDPEKNKINLHISKCFICVSKGKLCFHQKEKCDFFLNKWFDYCDIQKEYILIDCGECVEI